MLFQFCINRKTLQSYCQAKIDAKALQSVKSNYEGFVLRDVNIGLQHIALQRIEALKKEYINKYSDSNRIRLAIHLPPYHRSPAGYSLFTNLADSLKFMGVSVKMLDWNDNFSRFIHGYKPNILLTSDYYESLDLINWNCLIDYKKNYVLKVGLTANIEEESGLSIRSRLPLFREKDVDFFYSFRDKDYVNSRYEYQIYKNFGFDILFYEFGVNPLSYFPIDNTEKRFDFIFLGSSNPDKRAAYYSYFHKIFKIHHGFIDGPGWIHTKKFVFDSNLDKFLYSFGRVGLNLSTEDQLSYPCELNERTYMLAACGIPQLIDNPQLLSRRFSSDAYFSAGNPDEYYETFLEVLRNKVLAKKRARSALDEVFASHTTLHRGEIFYNQLKALL